MAAFAPITAILLGAVIAPTDPVLASEVQVDPPSTSGQKLDSNKDKHENKTEDEVRFALTSEAGFNDALAFPFTNLAIALATAGISLQPWWHSWLAIDVFYKLIVGGVVGWAMGKVLAKLLFAIPAHTDTAKAVLGLGALAATLLLYGTTELIGGYGFLAVFIGALTIRDVERDHEYHRYLHIFAEKLEQLLMAAILLGLGGAIADGLFAPLTWPLVITALLIVLIGRPVAGLVAFLGFKHISWKDRMAISFFGIRGIGSLYYLAYAHNQHTFPAERELWALVALVSVFSIIIHGILATPVMGWLDKQRKRQS